MQSDQPITCQACGAVVSTGGGRCPSCGGELPLEPVRPAPVSSASQLAPGVAALRQQQQAVKRRNMMIGGAMVGLAAVVIVVLLVFVLPKGDEQGQTTPTARASAASAPPSSSNALGIVTPLYVIPTELIPKARTKAKAWHKDAALVSIEAGPVVNGHLNLEEGATVRFEFGRPAGARLGPGTKVAAQERLVLIADADGIQSKKEPGTAAVAAAEPSCPFPDVWKKVTAAGIPADSNPTFRFARDTKRERELWTVTAQTGEGDAGETITRLVDGFKCTIILR